MIGRSEAPDSEQAKPSAAGVATEVAETSAAAGLLLETLQRSHGRSRRSCQKS